MTNTTNPPLTVVFDLDGTLIDTAPDLVRATNHVLAQINLAPVAAEKLKNWVGFGARRMIVQGLADAKVRQTEAQIDRLLEEFLTYYEANIAIDSQPYPGAVSALTRLQSAGHTLAMCTNKSEALARKLLAELALTDHFAAIAGRDTFAVSKPEPDHLLNTVKAAGGTAQRAIMIGDSITDIATAKAAKIPVIGVTHGYTDRPIQDLGPDAIISHFDGLDSAIQGMRAFP
ncbi:MAG: phosphoglycolate phosphatase [Alphaproteobacteria bacterium]|nr:phosphoglycolate phosphatase [Alphaproteobacteria bacterium]